MIIQVDTREHKKEWERIRQQFDALDGVDYFQKALNVGDYMNIDRPLLVIDRKKDLQELCSNITQQHDRFKRELLRAQENGIQLIILCEHGEGIQRLSDVHFWHNPRLDIYEWVIDSGHPCKVQKYPKATEGEALYKSLVTLRDKYHIDIQFCNKNDTGYAISHILE